ncbi:bifunctional 2-polyprenyl-6-hydroxyphenol methylase/3-demethylubiquinol 3-O-methyltransferase UbiG [Streptomyces sp. GESEQ-35]|uniref:class I SAM-dependent methyltransferase n=1 Tax=Streptomyces sp. GESEQ-35 TaxID=2812657 RepID=UPI001B33F437|nr:class I SAM-dependent methyltransferase [Streptomyces sp. GESEQ-35]
MPVQVSAWHFQALQRSAAGPAQALPVPKRMEWTTRRGIGPSAEILGGDLWRRRVLDLGCGPGHNVAHLAARRGALATGVDLVGLQVRRARSHYGRLDRVRFVAGHALTFLQTTPEQYDAIYSVFGAVGLVAPGLLLPAIAQHLKTGRVLAFSVPHPARGGRRPSPDDRPCPDFVTLPDAARVPIARWEFDARRWTVHLARAGFKVTSVRELCGSRDDRWPTTLLVTACKT